MSGMIPWRPRSLAPLLAPLFISTGLPSTVPAAAPFQSFAKLYERAPANAVGDLDGDGDFDLVMESSVWLENLGTDPPTFVRHPLGFWDEDLNQIRLADLDGDGSLDILGMSSSLVAYLNDGSRLLPGFHRVLLPLAYGEAWALGDFNGDGRLDVLRGIQDQFSNLHISLAIQPVRLTDPWQVVNVASPNLYPNQIVVGDVDGDGRLDFLVSGSPAGMPETFVLYRNQGGGSPSFAGATLGSELPMEVVVADLDGDGRQDLITARESVISVWENRGGDPIRFTVHTASSVFPSAARLATADFNGDGRLDILAASSDGKVAWLRHNGSFGFSEYSMTSSQANLLTTFLSPADMDRDGDPDVVFSGYSPSLGTAPFIGWYENATGLYQTSAVFVDENGDGVLEPGEAGELRVAFKNGGIGDVGGASITVSSKTSGLVFSQPTLDFGTLSPGQSKSALFPFTLGSPVVCGDRIEASIFSTSSAGSTSKRIEAWVGRQVVETVSESSSPALAIPDRDPVGVTTSIHLSAPSSTLRRLDVSVDITHSYRGDLSLRLRTPRGIVVNLFQGRGEPGTNLSQTFSIPEAVGEPADGAYLLTVIDHLGGDVGRLESWSLLAVVERSECSSGSPAPVPSEPSSDPSVVLNNLNAVQWESGFLSLFPPPTFTESGQGLGLEIAGVPNGSFGAWFTRQPLEPLSAGRYLIRAHLEETVTGAGLRHPEFRLRVHHFTNERALMAVAPEIVSGHGLPDVAEVIWQSDGISPWRVALDLLAFADDLDGGFTITHIEVVPLP